MSERLHVVPIEDLVEHNTNGDDCLCGPEHELVPGKDGSDNWLIIHHSLDGRELAEHEQERE